MLWAYQTTPRRSTGEAPFSVTCRTEAVILVEIGLANMRITRFSLCMNNPMLTKQLDFMEENKEIASIQLTNYQQRLSKGYNKNVRPRDFVTRDLVLRKVLRGMKELSLG